MNAKEISDATLESVTLADNDLLLIYDTSEGTTGKATIADLAPKVAENIDIATLPAVTPAADDVLMIRDTSEGTTGKATIADIISSAGWTDVSNEISYNSTYIDVVKAYTDGHLFEISIHYLAGTQDQTREVTLPTKYLPKPGITTTLASFYMNNVDAQQNIVGFITGHTVELRCYDMLRGPSGVYLYGIWGI